MLNFKSSIVVLGTLTLLLTLPTSADDWPTWGNTPARNMAAPNETGLPHDFEPGEFIGASDQIDASTSRNVKWIAKLGSQSYGNPTVSNGRVFIGTNNDSPRDPKYKGDRSTLLCLDEQTGDLHWQLNFPKLGTGKVSDWEFLGICSSPTVVGDRVYFVSNLCEVISADFYGLSNGNDGFDGEATLLSDSEEPLTLSETDGDIVWRFNMIDEVGVFPHNITSSAVLVNDDHVWTSTSNGVDYGHVETPAPFAPSLILLDTDGNLLGEEQSGLSQRIFHCNWSSPALFERSEEDGGDLCIFGGPDGWVYGFTSETEKDEDGFDVIKEAFRFDANPPEYRERDGKPIKYATRAGPSEVIASPVVYKGKVYVAIGQDPEHGEGAGNLVCIDPTQEGDTTDTAEVWSYRLINRSLSTIGIIDDLLFIADYSGFVYCFDAMTGELYWKHDTLGHIWASPLVADGKVFIGNEDGYLTILEAKKEKNVLNEVDMRSPIYSSPIAANGVLYVGTHTHLFAIAEGAEPPAGDTNTPEPVGDE